MSDVEGLNNAYKSSDNIYINNDTLYISGTKHVDSIIEDQIKAPGYYSLFKSVVNNEFQDIYDDIKIPLNLTRYTQRYNEADKVLKEHPEITKLIGHSLGGSVSLELEKNNPQLTFDVRTYGAPVMSSTDSGNRYRAAYDPVSMFDTGATTIYGNTYNPHSYDNGFDNNSNNFKNTK